jgi:hypothetical protein
MTPASRRGSLADMRRIFFAACLIALAAPVASLVAQGAKPNFSGTWNLDVAKSDFGGAPAPDSIVHVIEHKDPSLKVTTTQKGQQGEVTNTRNLTTDGKETVNKMRTMVGEQDVTSTTKWNGNKLANVYKVDIQGTAIEINEAWEVSEGGKVLSVSRDVKTPQGDFHQQYVFNKQ